MADEKKAVPEEDAVDILALLEDDVAFDEYAKETHAKAKAEKEAETADEPKQAEPKTGYEFPTKYTPTTKITIDLEALKELEEGLAAELKKTKATAAPYIQDFPPPTGDQAPKQNIQPPVDVDEIWKKPLGEPGMTTMPEEPEAQPEPQPVVEDKTQDPVIELNEKLKALLEGMNELNKIPTHKPAFTQKKKTNPLLVVATTAPPIGTEIPPILQEPDEEIFEVVEAADEEEEYIEEPEVSFIRCKNYVPNAKEVQNGARLPAGWKYTTAKGYSWCLKRNDVCPFTPRYGQLQTSCEIYDPEELVLAAEIGTPKGMVQYKTIHMNSGKLVGHLYDGDNLLSQVDPNEPKTKAELLDIAAEILAVLYEVDRQTLAIKLVPETTEAPERSLFAELVS